MSGAAVPPSPAAIVNAEMGLAGEDLPGLAAPHLDAGVIGRLARRGEGQHTHHRSFGREPVRLTGPVTGHVRATMGRLQTRDPGLAVLRYATRAVLVVPAVADEVIRDSQAAACDVSGSITLSLLAETGGPVRGLLAAYLCLAPAGAVAIAAGTLCSGSAWVAALLTFTFAGRHPGNASAAELVGADHTRPPLLRRHRIDKSMPGQVHVSCIVGRGRSAISSHQVGLSMLSRTTARRLSVSCQKSVSL